MKSVNRKNSMTHANVDQITGANILFQDVPGSTRRIRCPSGCPDHVNPVKAANGTLMYRCGVCTFRSVAF
jgi:hypothetical protein